MSRRTTGRGQCILLASLLVFTLLSAPARADASGPGDLIDDFIAANSLNERNFALAFRSTYDGTEYLYNADKLFDTASLYKGR